MRWNFEHFEKKDGPLRVSNFEITDSENIVREMSKKSRLREPFDKQHGERAQTVFRCESENLHQNHWSLPSQLSWKTSPWLTCKIFWLLVNTFAANEKYLVLDRDNLAIPIQMQLSQKQKTFSRFFAAFLKFRLILNILSKNMTLIDFVMSKLRTPKSWSDKSLKSPVSADPSTSNIVNVLKLCWNLHQCTFILLFDHWNVSGVEKTFPYWHGKSWDCLLKHWLSMKSIPILRERI